jgi:DNA-directed RNA polymerase subunit RPC12/RpoP
MHPVLLINCLYMDNPDKIIVFDSYDTVMAANLVKTKLDAYGIPCFLSDENFVGLYPIRNELFSGVRLHVFEKDRDRVKEVLTEEMNLEKETLQCPHCRSHHVALSTNKPSTIRLVLSMIFVSPFLEEKKIYRCDGCGKEFESVDVH